MRRERFTLGSTRHYDQPIEDRPEVKIARLRITSGSVGGVLTLGLGVLLWIAVPVFRIFLLSVLALGGLLGLVLWWKHR